MKLRFWLVGMLAVVLAMLPLVASADGESTNVGYDASASVLYAGTTQGLIFAPPELAALVGAVPDTDTESHFKFHNDGSIKKVEVKTTNELVVSVFGVPPTCNKPDPFCGFGGAPFELFGSFGISLHRSEVDVKNVVFFAPDLTPVTDPSLAIYLAGEIKGDLESEFSLVKPGFGTMEGTADLKIEGTATYVCLSTLSLEPPGPTVLSIGACAAGIGKLVHPELSTVDEGKFRIESTTGAWEDVKKNGGKLTVVADLSGGVVLPTSGVAIENAKLEYEKDDDDDEDDEDEEDEDDDD